jgi:hypothetical protein
MIVVHNLSLSYTPHHSCFAVESSKNLTFPTVVSSPPIFILVEIKCILGRHTSHIYVQLIGKVGDVVGRMPEDVDILAVDVSIGCNVAVLGIIISVPPITVVAIPLGYSGYVVD